MSTQRIFDVANVRQDFPILHQSVHGNHWSTLIMRPPRKTCGRTRCHASVLRKHQQ